MHTGLTESKADLTWTQKLDNTEALGLETRLDFVLEGLCSLSVVVLS